MKLWQQQMMDSDLLSVRKKEDLWMQHATGAVIYLELLVGEIVGGSVAAKYSQELALELVGK